MTRSTKAEQNPMSEAPKAGVIYRWRSGGEYLCLMSPEDWNGLVVLTTQTDWQPRTSDQGLPDHDEIFTISLSAWRHNAPAAIDRPGSSGRILTTTSATCYHGAQN